MIDLSVDLEEKKDSQLNALEPPLQDSQNSKDFKDPKDSKNNVNRVTATSLTTTKVNETSVSKTGPKMQPTKHDIEFEYDLSTFHKNGEAINGMEVALSIYKWNVWCQKIMMPGNLIRKLVVSNENPAAAMAFEVNPKPSEENEPSVLYAIRKDDSITASLSSTMIPCKTSASETTNTVANKKTLSKSTKSNKSNVHERWMVDRFWMALFRDDDS